MDLSIVIPVYNEVEKVARLHISICDALMSIAYPFEIVVVDDGKANLARAQSD